MKKTLSTLLLVLFMVLGVIIVPLNAQGLDSLVEYSHQFAQQQLANTVNEIGDPTRYARNTLEDGTWNTTNAGSWTSGFFPGSLWYMYESTGDPRWREWAETWTAGLENEKNDTGTHDVGFKIFSSFGHGYRLTGNVAYREIILQAARSLATRFNPTVGCIRSWDWGPWADRFPVIIDNMMNLELLFWASKNGGESAWYDMAVSHALQTMKNHVRADGSTYHVVDYDPSAGEVIEKVTWQGYADESTWSRGQAWGVYGFTMAYRETGDIRFLNTAQQLADYFIDHLPEDQVPYWDFEAPNIPQEERDSSAAAIAASGLLELSALVTDRDAQAKYRHTAQDILAFLSSPAYLAEGTNSSGILLYAVGHRPANKEVDVSLIYADYYFVEALTRYQAGKIGHLDINRAIVRLNPKANKDRFQVWGKFIFGEMSDGINILNEDVTVTFDEFAQTMPAGSFFRIGKNASYYSNWKSGGIRLMVIRDDGRFLVWTQNLDLSGIDLNTPVPFSLEIGDDLGKTEIPFDASGRFRK